MSELSATPVKRPLALGLAKAANRFMDYSKDPNNILAQAMPFPPEEGAGLTSGFASLLGIPEAASLLEKLAYGEKLTTGKNQTIGLKPDVLEGAASLAPAVGGLTKGLAKVAGKVPLQRASSPNALVWHGSPYKFDKFDSSKIGTGEGAQAYGHGLYFAENPKVAQDYKRALSPGRGNSDDDTIARVLDAVGNPLNAAVELERRAQYANISGGKERLLGLAEKLRAGYDPRGSLYGVDLPDNQIAKMLDWDKPLAAQSGNVQKGLAQSESVRAYMANAEAQRLRLNSGYPERLTKIPSATKPYDATRMLGKDAYTALSQEYTNQRLVAERLKELDIPGIRYLDGSSRNLGDGTSNFVIHPGNESFLQILERNGIPLNSGLARGR